MLAEWFVYPYPYPMQFFSLLNSSPISALVWISPHTTTIASNNQNADGVGLVSTIDFNQTLEQLAPRQPPFPTLPCRLRPPLRHLRQMTGYSPAYQWRYTKIIFIKASCRTAVFRVVTQRSPPHKRLLRIEPHSFPAVSQLEFSSHFLEGVRTTFAVLWLLRSQLCFYLCPYVNHRTIEIVAWKKQ